MNSDRLIDELVPLLADETVAWISREPTGSPLVRLKIYYYDTSAPCCYLPGYALTAADRDSMMENEGPEAVRNIWCDDRSYEVELGISNESRASELLKSLYELMCEEENATLSRKLAIQVCISLNALAWPGHICVSDDFVAYPTNGTDHGCDEYEDICKSVPVEKLELLRKRGFMGEGSRDWCTRPNFPTKADFVAKIKTRIDSLPKGQRVDGWIEVLDLALAGTDPDLKMMGVESDIPLYYLKEFGRGSAMPLLRLAAKWSDRIDIWEDGWQPTIGIPERMYEIIDFVRAHGEATAEARQLLNQVLLKAQNYPLMGLAFSCCNALHCLFDGYPKPTESDGGPDYRPENLVDFTSRIELG